MFIPNQAILSGDLTAWTTKTLPAPFIGNKISPSLYNASAFALATKYLPTSTAADGKYVYGPSNPQSENEYIGHLDWNKSEKQTVFGRYYITHFKQPGFFDNNLLLTVNAQLDDQEQSLTLGYTYSISSSLVNSFRVAGTRSFITRGQVSSLINPKTVGINVATPVPNDIYIAVSGDFTESCGTCETYQVTTNRENVVDDVFWTKGRHRFGFGGNIVHRHLNLQGTNNANGPFTFNGSFTGDAMADFLMGNLYSLYQGNNTGSPFSNNAFAMYVQDSYQMMPPLTINAGVRWESDLPEWETAGRGGSFSISAFNAGKTSTTYKTAPPGLIFAGAPCIPKGHINNHWDHFEPRFGFAWDPGERARRVSVAHTRWASSNRFSIWKIALRTTRILETQSPSIPRRACSRISMPTIPAEIPFPSFPAKQNRRLLPDSRFVLPVPCDHEAELYADLEPDYSEAVRRQLGNDGG